MIFWFFGYSGAGKSTLVDLVSQKLGKEVRIKVLDGDALRSGLNSDLGFNIEDRNENLRRVAHICNIFKNDFDYILCSFITPLKTERSMLKNILGNDLKLIFVDADISVCEKRDPKGLYKKARRGEIALFTGISSPFDYGDDADFIIDTNKTVNESLNMILDYMNK